MDNDHLQDRRQCPKCQKLMNSREDLQLHVHVCNAQKVAKRFQRSSKKVSLTPRVVGPPPYRKIAPKIPVVENNLVFGARNQGNMCETRKSKKGPVLKFNPIVIQSLREDDTRDISNEWDSPHWQSDIVSGATRLESHRDRPVQRGIHQEPVEDTNTRLDSDLFPPGILNGSTPFSPVRAGVESSRSSPLSHFRPVHESTFEEIAPLRERLYPFRGSPLRPDSMINPPDGQVDRVVREQSMNQSPSVSGVGLDSIRLPTKVDSYRSLQAMEILQATKPHVQTVLPSLFSNQARVSLKSFDKSPMYEAGPPPEICVNDVDIQEGTQDPTPFSNPALLFGANRQERLFKNRGVLKSQLVSFSEQCKFNILMLTCSCQTEIRKLIYYFVLQQRLFISIHPELNISDWILDTPCCFVFILNAN